MRLENHLSILRRSRLVRDWHDRRIGAGHEWAGAIDDELERAQIILLLVSPDFIASDYCWDVELQRALERHEAGAAVVIPVILRPVLWQDAPFGKLQALPRDARPITSWRNRDSAFLNVAEGIKAAVAEISARVTIPARVRRVSPPHNPAFTGRDTELERLDQLLRDHHVVAITGRGGAGKTQLAAEFCYRHADDYEIVWWIRAEEPATIGIDLAELAGALALPEATSPIRAEAVEAAQRTLARGENWLLVFDDANSWEEIRRFLPDDLKGTVLMTSRSLDGAEEVAALPVDVLTTSAARRFLIERTGQDDPAAADEVAAVAGYLPLELEQAAAYVEATSTDLAAHAATLRFEATVRAATASVLAKVELESAAAADLISLAAFLAPADIPVDLLAPQFEESVARRLGGCRRGTCRPPPLRPRGRKGP